MRYYIKRTHPNMPDGHYLVTDNGIGVEFGVSAPKLELTQAQVAETLIRCQKHCITGSIFTVERKQLTNEEKLCKVLTVWHAVKHTAGIDAQVAMSNVIREIGA